MNTYGEVIYIILDELKLISDDASFEEDHIIHLLHNYRSALLKQRYSDVRRDIALPNFQKLEVSLNAMTNLPTSTYGTSKYLKSTIPIPSIINFNGQLVTKLAISGFSWSGELNIMNWKNFKYTGYSKYDTNTIYATIDQDNYLYLKCMNPDILNLTTLTLTSIFEDPKEVYDITTPSTINNVYNILDKIFPLESEIHANLRALVIKDLYPHLYNPEDNVNNADEDLPSVKSK